VKGVECSCLLCLAARATALGDRRGPRVTKDFEVIVPDESPSRTVSRRGLLGLIGAAATAAAVAPAQALAARAPAPAHPTEQAQVQAQQMRRRAPATRMVTKRVWLYNANTGETFNEVYWQNGQYVGSSLSRLNVLLRDHRSGAVAHIDPKLFDLLSQMHRTLRLREPFQVISGYRSPETNFQLYMQSSGGVAESSFHIRGMAVDILTHTRSSRQMVRVARAINVGGVGNYRGARYIHVDTGPVRTWSY
jgi:uncharacterized protein YcbK (DUF882 family)